MITASQVKIFINKEIAGHLGKLAEHITTASVDMPGAKQKDITKLKKALLVLSDKHNKKAHDISIRALTKNDPNKVPS